MPFPSVLLLQDAIKIKDFTLDFSVVIAANQTKSLAEVGINCDLVDLIWLIAQARKEAKITWTTRCILSRGVGGTTVSLAQVVPDIFERELVQALVQRLSQAYHAA